MPHPLRVILLAALWLTAWSAPSTAADIAREYSVYGREMAGGSYTGKVALAKDGDTYTVIWVFGTDVHRGTAILNGDSLAVSFIVRASPVPGLALFRVEQDGTLTGQFTVLGGKKVGAEIWRPVER